jgi:hypothetical protein
MIDKQSPFTTLLASTELAGDAPRAARIRADRACTELRHGRALALSSHGGWLLAAAVETLSETLLQQLLQAGPAPQLLLSGERLLALGVTKAPARSLLPPLPHAPRWPGYSNWPVCLPAPATATCSVAPPRQQPTTWPGLPRWRCASGRA